MPGIDPGTSHMLSVRSTTWATSPYDDFKYANLVTKNKYLIKICNQQYNKVANNCRLISGKKSFLILFMSSGDVAQVVERTLSMCEVPGSIPGISRSWFYINKTPFSLVGLIFLLAFRSQGRV